tara:strand:+ start:994 stop:1113 length:120 start_codon:yes stop_codon:yes gene_type:complete
MLPGLTDDARMTPVLPLRAAQSAIELRNRRSSCNRANDY